MSNKNSKQNSNQNGCMHVRIPACRHPLVPVPRCLTYFNNMQSTCCTSYNDSGIHSPPSSSSSLSQSTTSVCSSASSIFLSNWFIFFAASLSYSAALPLSLSLFTLFPPRVQLQLVLWKHLYTLCCSECGTLLTSWLESSATWLAQADEDIEHADRRVNEETREEGREGGR